MCERARARGWVGRECAQRFKTAIADLILSVFAPAAKQVLEKGYYNRALHLEKTFAGAAPADSHREHLSRAGRGGGIPYRLGGELEREEGRAGVSGGDKESGAEEGEGNEGGLREDLLVHAVAQAEGSLQSTLSSVRGRCTIGRVEGRRGLSASPIEDDRAVAAQSRRFTPKPPAVHFSKGLHTEHAPFGGRGKGNGGQAREEAAKEREGGPRSSRLHPIAVTEVSAAEAQRRAEASGKGKGRVESGRELGALGQMLNDDVHFLQRLVRGEM